MQPHTIIFLDIDGTLIDINQKPNTDTLPPLITEMQQTGYQFGINSNRSKEDVLPVQEQFSIDGPLILENGAYIIDFDGVETTLFSSDINIPALTLAAVTDFKDNNPDVQSLETTDTTKLYTSNESHKPGLHLFINCYRKHSSSIHHRVNGISDYSITERISEHLQRFFTDRSLPLSAVPHHHGHSVTIEVEGVSKATALEEYRRMHATARFIAIGDGINDVVLKPYVDELYAVSNATPELKSIAQYTSPLPITLGVVDILNKIKNRASTTDSMI